MVKPVLSPMGDSYEVEKSAAITTDTAGGINLRHEDERRGPDDFRHPAHGDVHMSQSLTLRAQAFTAGM